MNVVKQFPVIAIVGVCASGKSTIVRELLATGINCRHVAQEHSYVKDMWQRLVHPDFLVYLEVSYTSTIARKKLNWTLEEYEEQLRRIRHAKEHADLIIDTDAHSIAETLVLIKTGINTAGLVTPANGVDLNS
jgi:hypothetical protein